MRQLVLSALLGAAGAAHDGVTDYEKFVPNYSSGDPIPFHFSIIAPEGTTEPLPVIFFVTGVSGMMGVGAYSDMLEQIAYKGYIVVGLSHLEMPEYNGQGRDFHDVLVWTGNGGLGAAFLEQNITALLDVDKTTVMAQSAGNHVVGQGLVVGCSIAKALVMIDPVDGFDPWGKITLENLITPGDKLPYNIPALHLDSYLDPALDKFGMACSPAALSGPRWFDAMAGPVWNANATKYGHLDCLDNDVNPAMSGVMCPGSSLLVSNTPYHQMLADSVGIFLGALFDSRPNDFKLLENARKFAVKVEVKQDLKGLRHQQIKPGCIHYGHTAIVV